MSLQNDEITGYNAVLEKSGMLVISLDWADDRNKTEGSMTVTLKTTEGKRQRYEMNAFKPVNDYSLANKMLLSFKESNL